MELTDKPDLKQRIIEESKRYLSSEPNENEWTVDQFMRWNNIKDRNVAYRALKAMELDGKITKRKGSAYGASCNVYKEVQ